MAIDDWPAVAIPGGSEPPTEHILHSNDVTVGEWATEEESATALDDTLRIADLWKVYSEVRGTLVQPRPGQVDKGLRIDRILVPNKRLLDLGWTHGVVGIEIKRSGTKIGPAIAQAMNYGRSVWTLPGGLYTWLSWVFIWPMGKLTNTVESICAQHRIGSAMSNNWVLLRLQSGLNLLTIQRHSGEIHIGSGTNGNRSGSR